MLLVEIKRRMMAAMKAGDVVTKEILRTAVGEISMQGERAGGVSDELSQQVLRKLIKSNHETLGYARDEAQTATLKAEIAVLEDLLPKSLGVDAIVEALGPVAAAIKAAGNDGQATGVAMKHLKTTGAVVDGRSVGDAVKKIRG
ncbi:MAG: GatB/YqeY domain-containing protein [Myxococcales bacterium]|nr:GatB/YqeY domain-containing protein [Myxococcales bacterium]